MLLWQRGETLDEEELERVVVRANHEALTPKVGPLMTNNLHQADEFTLIRSELHVPRQERSAEERDRASALVQDCAESQTRGVAVHGEVLIKIWQLENWGRGQRLLERRERNRCCLIPQERVLAKKLCEGRCYGAEVLDEAAVISRQAEEAAETPR